MSDLSTMIKRLLLPVIFASAAFHIPVQANTVRIVGPAADEQPATIVETVRNTSTNRSSATRYGPTANNETLWSIATRNRPNNQVSVYQVIGAIHRANPQAFEQNNIHGLIPGSVLTIPSLGQIRQENIDSVKRRLAADQRRQSRQTSSSAPSSAPAPRVNTPAPTVVAQPIPKPDVAKEELVSQAAPKVSSEASSSSAPQNPKGGIPLKPTALQAQLDASDVQMTKLLESNHLLRVRLAEMQHEVTALKDQISSDEILREQIKGFIQQQKVQQVEPVVVQTSWIDSLIANPWALAAVAFLPGSLIAGALAFFMLRRKKEGDDEVKSLDSPEQKPAMVPPPEDDAVNPELPLSDDNDIDDLFGGDDDSLFDDPEKSLFSGESDKEVDSIDMLDLSTDSSDEFEIDSGLTPSSISVKGDEQAIGLQDMERALDEMEQSSEPNSDEALAAMWEQSLQSEADDEDSFDLSDDSTVGLDDDLLGEQKIEDGLLDQSILDDLLSEVEMEQDSHDQPAQEDASQQVVDQDDLDSLFDSVEVEETPESPSPVSSEQTDVVEEAAQQAAVDQALADADAMFAVESEAVDEGDIDALFEANSTALLDELIEEDDELSTEVEVEVEENSTALLDELLGEDDTSDLLNPSVSIDENSTALLDELVDDLDDDLDDVDNDGLATSDPKLNDEEELNLDDVVIDENSTDLLDDILAQHSSLPELSTSEPEPQGLDEPLGTHDQQTIDEQQAIDELPGDSVGSDLPEPEMFETDFSDPEFEPVPDNEDALSQQQQAPDADFPEPEQSAFAEIFNEALDEQPAEPDPEPQADPAPVSEPVAESIQEQELIDALTQEPEQQLAPEPVLDSEADAEQQENESLPQQEPVEADEIDALLADVEGLLDEPETDDVEVLGRSVDELLESFEEQPEQSAQEGSALDAIDAGDATDSGVEDPALEEPDGEDAGTQESGAEEFDVEKPSVDGADAEEADTEVTGFDEPNLAESALDKVVGDTPVEPEETVLTEAYSDELPVSNDEVALAEPEPLSEPQAETPVSVDEPHQNDVLGNDIQDEQVMPEPSSLDELPEFDEEQQALDNVVQQLQQAAEAAQPQTSVTEDQAVEGLASEGLNVDIPAMADEAEYQSVDDLLDASFDDWVPEEPTQEEVQPEEALAKQPELEAPEPLSLDDLPEFDEEAAFNDPEAEELEDLSPSLSEDEEQQALDNIVKQLQQAAEASLPENVVAPDLASDESVTEELTPEAPSAVDDSEYQSVDDLLDASPEPLTLDELPEFDEEAAFNDPEAEELEELSSPLSEDEEQHALDNIVKQLQQAAEAVQADSHEPEAEQSPAEEVDAESAEPAPASIHGEQTIEFESIDPSSLPEFSEDEALQASFDEQHELEQYEVEQGLREPQAAKPLQPETPPADMFDDEFVDSAGLDMAALLSDPEEAFAGSDNVQAENTLAGNVLEAEVEAQPIEPTVQENEHAQEKVHEQEEEPAPQDAVVELEDTQESLSIDSAWDDNVDSVSEDIAGESVPEPVHSDLNEFVADNPDDIDTKPSFDFQDELEAEREQLLSNTFDGDDEYSSFSGSELEMPEEDSAIWAATSPEPVLETENWAEQPQMQIEDVAAFDTEMLLAEAESQALLDDIGGSELVTDADPSPAYISIDELMKDIESEHPVEVEEEPLNLEVGLDEFPDVLSDVAAFDVDSQGEYASKLDLAKAYLEMNDSEGALGLLEEVASNGDAQIKREAKGLLDKVRGSRS
ncbi:FimV/HubP family polar landmark protein [Photobacterium kasasachensis]|uniref:FimV/HubP family polar landmark protein n=1 Tax=Photobacterium kasasachensis TaxID=2910240 RepID=UPI003D131090